MPRPTKDRRLAPRYRIDAAIKVNEDTAMAIDLSSRGVFFEAAAPLAPGDQIALVLPYEHTAPGASVTCVAEVVRIEPRGRFYGVAARYEPACFRIPA